MGELCFLRDGWGSGELSKSLTEFFMVVFLSRLASHLVDSPVDFSVSLPYFQSFSFHINCCGVYEEFLLSYFVDKSIFLVESPIYSELSLIYLTEHPPRYPSLT